MRCSDTLIEAKTTGTPMKPAKSASVSLKVLEKISEEAYSEGRMPAVALRIHNPSSFLADSDGNVDIICRLVRDDIQRRNIND